MTKCFSAAAAAAVVRSDLLQFHVLFLIARKLDSNYDLCGDGVMKFLFHLTS